MSKGMEIIDIAIICQMFWLHTLPYPYNSLALFIVSSMWLLLHFLRKIFTIKSIKQDKKRRNIEELKREVKAKTPHII